MKTQWGRVSFVIVAMLAGCAGRSENLAAAAPAREALAVAMTRRLGLAGEVAWYKYREGLPVADRRRESELLEAAVARGRALDLSERRVRRYFEAQMRASRIYQRTLLSQWRRGGDLPATPPRDLLRGIRPEIGRLNEEILRGFAVMGDIPRDPHWAGQIKKRMMGQGIPGSASRVAVAPLR